MNCEEFNRSLHRHFQGRLSPETTRAMETHAGECGRCGDLFSTARELSCEEFVRFLDDYVEETLVQTRREVFERHIALCPDCTAYLESYRQSMARSADALSHDQFAEKALPPALLRAILRAREDAG